MIIGGYKYFGYYAALINVITSTFYQFEQSRPPSTSSGTVGMTMVETICVTTSYIDI